MTTDDLAALLAEHGDYILLHPEDGEAGYYCDCGQRLTDAFDDLDFAAHQAAVVGAWLAEHEYEENEENRWYRSIRRDTGTVWTESRSLEEVWEQAEGYEVDIFVSRKLSRMTDWEEVPNET